MIDVLRSTERRLERVDVLGDLADTFDMPSVGLEALARIVGQRELGAAVDGDVVVVVDDDELAQTEMARQ